MMANRRNSFTLVLALGAVAWSSTARANPNDSLKPALAGYWDSGAHVEYVFYMDYAGNIQQLSHDGGGWHHAQVTSAQSPAGLAFLPGSQLLSYYDGGTGHLFYLGGSVSNGTAHLVELKGNPPSASNATDISAAGASPVAFPNNWTSCFPSCSTLPGVIFSTTLTGFVDSFGFDHVFYASSDLTIHESYFAGGWFDHSLGGAPANVHDGNNLTSCWDGTYEHVYFTGPDPLQHLVYANGAWSQASLSGANMDGALAAVCFPSGGGSEQLVIGQSGDADILEYVGTGVGNGGTVTNQSQPPHFTMASVFPLIAYGGGGVFYVGDDYNLYQAGNGTQATLLTAPGSLKTTPPKVANWNGESNVNAAPIIGFSDGTDDHVFYIGTDSRVHHFAAVQGNQTWTLDLSIPSSVPAAGN